MIANKIPVFRRQILCVKSFIVTKPIILFVIQFLKRGSIGLTKIELSAFHGVRDTFNQCYYCQAFF
jgi:hypothetical protein